MSALAHLFGGHAQAASSQLFGASNPYKADQAAQPGTGGSKLQAAAPAARAPPSTSMQQAKMMMLRTVRTESTCNGKCSGTSAFAHFETLRGTSRMLISVLDATSM